MDSNHRTRMRADLQSAAIATMRYLQIFHNVKEPIEGNDGFEPSANRLTVYCSTAELIPQNKKTPNFSVRGLYII